MKENIDLIMKTNLKSSEEDAEFEVEVKKVLW